MNPDADITVFGPVGARPLDVSCLLATYAGDDPSNLEEALKSIEAQRSVSLELILVIDGDLPQKNREIVRAFGTVAQWPMKAIQMAQNEGLACALNIGLDHCDGEFVARFDADDISHPERLMTQVAYLRRHQNIDVLGSSLALIDDSGNESGSKRYPLDHRSIRRSFFLRNPIAHPSAMFRKTAIRSLGGYPDFRRSQDYALWGLCLANGLSFANLPNELVQMRVGSGFSRRRGREYFKTEVKVLRYLHDTGSLSKLEFAVAYVLRFVSRHLNEIRSSWFGKK